MTEGSVESRIRVKAENLDLMWIQYQEAVNRKEGLIIAPEVISVDDVLAVVRQHRTEHTKKLQDTLTVIRAMFEDRIKLYANLGPDVSLINLLGEVEKKFMELLKE